MSIYFHGVGECTVEKLRAFDLSTIDSFAANDLIYMLPEIDGSPEELVQLFLSSFSLGVIGWCYVIPPGSSHPDATLFGHCVEMFNPCGARISPRCLLLSPSSFQSSS